MFKELKETKRIICMTRNINKDTLEKGDRNLRTKNYKNLVK